MIGKIAVNSYETGKVSCYFDKIILLDKYFYNQEVGYNYKAGSSCTIYAISLFGREEDVKVIAASFLESYNLEIEIIGIEDYLGRAKKSYNENYSMFNSRLATSNNRPFLHKVIYNKTLVDNNVLIISKSKQDVIKRIWDNVEQQCKKVPIPEFYRKTLWEEQIVPFLYYATPLSERNTIRPSSIKRDEVCGEYDSALVAIGFEDFIVVLNNARYNTNLNDYQLKEAIKESRTGESRTGHKEIA